VPDPLVTEQELDALVSHVLALRMDFIQRLLATARIPYSGLRKAELRDRLREGLDDRRLVLSEVVRFLDEVEPGGKQHVFLVRPHSTLNGDWSDPAANRRRLRQRRDLRALVDASLPVMMPDELTLSAIRLGPDRVEITGVEARHYDERDERLDQITVSPEGLRVELRAHVQRVARTIVRLRWDTGTRHAALHITQASGRGVERDYYRDVFNRLGQAVSPWLDLSAFGDVDLHTVIHELHDRERSGRGVLTRSRRGRWETTAGAEMEAISASTSASVFQDPKITAAIGAVADRVSGQAGNLYWLQLDGNPLSEELHTTIVAFDSRVHFMRPSDPASVDHVIGQIRRLL
jgi:hypothetical protein